MKTLNQIYSDLVQVNQNLGGVSFNPLTDGLYATYKVGADTVVKKLGEPTLFMSNVELLDNSHTKAYVNIDCTSIDGYKNMSSDNFFLFVAGVRTHGITGSKDYPANGLPITKMYNSTTGILTISNGGGYVANQLTLWSIGIIADIYFK